MVTQRLRYTAETFAAHRHNRLVDLLCSLFRYRFDVIADQADRAFGLNRDALVQREQPFDFADQLGQLLVAAEHDVLFLKIGSEVHRAECIDSGRTDVIVAASGAGVLTTAHRAV